MTILFSTALPYPVICKTLSEIVLLFIFPLELLLILSLKVWNLKDCTGENLRIAEDHVSMFQKSLLKIDEDLKRDEDTDDDCNDNLDADEAEHIQKGLLEMIADELDDKEDKSRSSSNCENIDEENDTNLDLLDRNSKLKRTE